MPIRAKKFLIKQYSDLKTNEISSLSRKVVRIGQRVARLFAIIAVWPLTVVLVALSPVYRIRFGFFFTDRIGHYAFDAAYQLAESAKPNSPTSSVDFFFCKGPICNHFLRKVISRRVKHRELSRYFFYASMFVPLGARVRVLPARARNGSRDPKGLISAAGQRFYFSHDEESIGFDYLRGKGWSEGEPYVCLVVRDSKYLSSSLPDKVWDYHAYRDTEIRHYQAALESLADLGYWVFRMGSNVGTQLISSRPQIVDYANSEDQSETLDVWLMANCKFCISTSTGLDSVADIFLKPTIFLNFLPLAYFQTWSNCVLAPSHLIWRSSGQRLSCMEHFRNAFIRQEDYDTAGIIVRPLDSREITAIVIEGENCFSRRESSPNHSLANQKRFWMLYTRYQQAVPKALWFNENAQISNEFLRLSPEFLN